MKVLIQSNMRLRIIKFIIYCLKVVGLAPCSIRVKALAKGFRNTHNWDVEFSKVGMGYNLLISILITTTAACSLQSISSKDYTNKSSLTLTTGTAQHILVVFASFVLLISWTFKQRKGTSVINKLLDVNARLSHMEIPPCYKKTSTHLFVHVIFGLFFFIAAWIHLYFFMIDDGFSIWILFPLAILVIFWYIIEYSMIVGLVTAQFESVNKNLLNLKQTRHRFSIDPLFNPHFEVSNSSIHDQLAALQLLQSIRNTLLEISEEIADFFSFPVLICFGYSFTLIVSEIHYLIIPVVSVNSKFSLFQFYIAMNWILIAIHPIISLLFNVTESASKAKLTGRIIHKLLISSRNQEIKERLQQFSLQLLHENFKYTACGFFTLDFTLLFTMLGSAVTYLVILIQFH